VNIEVLVARKQLGLTQQALSVRVGLTPNDISRIEKFGWTPPPDVQQRLAEALQVESRILFQSQEVA